MIPRFITIAAGVWLMFAPAVLGYGDPAAANDRLVGPAVAGTAFVALWEVVRSVRWIALPFGLWLALAPFVLGYSETAATVSSVVAAVVIVASTPPSPGDPSRFAGGWLSLTRRRETQEGIS
jgi:hypothetical protein